MEKSAKSTYLISSHQVTYRPVPIFKKNIALLTPSFGIGTICKLHSAETETLNGAAIAMARSRCVSNVFEIKAFSAFFPGSPCLDRFGVPISSHSSGSNHKDSGS